MTAHALNDDLNGNAVERLRQLWRRRKAKCPA